MTIVAGIVSPKVRVAVAGLPLDLRLLGDFTASSGGLRLRLTTRKAKALIAYLALSESGHDTRGRLVGLLWSESDEDRARASLRQAVHEIKSACDEVGFDGFAFGKQTLALRRDRFTCDLDEVFSAVAGRRVHARLVGTQRLSETLLENLDGLDPGFEIWVRAKRQLLHDKFTSALEAMLQPEGAAAAAPAAVALLNLDPTHEPACRHLIRVHAKQGDVGGAMKLYKTLWDILEADFDVEPSQQTQDLIVGIRSQCGAGKLPIFESAAPARAQAPSASAGLAISVYAFDAGGVSPDRRYIIGGFRHELVACLARFREWSVRAPTTEQQRIDSPGWSSPPEYLIEGTTYEAAGALRLIITFRDAATSVCIWSERFTLDLATWFDAQQHIVRRIATALNVHLSAERLRRIAADGTVDLDVHDRWLRGQSLVHHLAPADWDAAAAIFEGLVLDAPDFVPGLTSLVQLHNTEHIAKPGRFRSMARHPETLARARRAANLDPLDARAQLNLAWTHQLAARTEEATLHASLAVDMNGNDPWTLMSAGQIFAYCGDHIRAEDLAAASIDSTPMVAPQQMTYLSAIKFLSGDYRTCAEAANHGLETSPSFRAWGCAALAHLGRHAEASAELIRAYGEIAREWHGATAPSPAAMTHWMLHAFPIAIANDWERLRHGLALAGAPVADLTFGTW